MSRADLLYKYLDSRAILTPFTHCQRLSRIPPISISSPSQFPSYFLTMVLTAAGFTSLLHSLGLMQGTFKPTPASFSYGQSHAQNKVASTSPAASNLGSNFQSPPTGNISATESHSVVCNVQPYDAPELGEQAFAPFDQAKANVYRYRQQQSVNLGSW